MENIFFEGDVEDFRERMIWAINEFCGPANYKFLEKKFGIGARKWQNMCNRAQQPSVEMLAAIATVRPYFVFWLLTGKELDVPQLNPENKNWNDYLWQNIHAKTEGVSFKETTKNPPWKAKKGERV